MGSWWEDYKGAALGEREL